MTNIFEFSAGLLSLVLLVYGLKVILFDALSKMVKERGKRENARILDAELLFNEAEKQHKQWSEKFSGLKNDIKLIEEKACADAEKLLEESRLAAEKESSLVVNNANKEAASLSDKAKRDIFAQLADRVSKEAEKLLRDSLDRTAQGNIAENILNKIGAKDA